MYLVEGFPNFFLLIGRVVGAEIYAGRRQRGHRAPAALLTTTLHQRVPPARNACRRSFEGVGI
jgi:hypothetical protein